MRVKGWMTENRNIVTHRQYQEILTMCMSSKYESAKTIFMNYIFKNLFNV